LTLRKKRITTEQAAAARLSSLPGGATPLG
jgi:hypothetical protein